MCVWGGGEVEEMERERMRIFASTQKFISTTRTLFGTLVWAEDRRVFGNHLFTTEGGL